jgi:hypothetical protein
MEWKGVGVHPPPSPAWANFTLLMECTPESSRYYSVYSVEVTVNSMEENFSDYCPNYVQKFGLWKRKVSWNATNHSEASAPIYWPSFCENKPKTLVFVYWKRSFWACFCENWVYKFGHCAGIFELSMGARNRVGIGLFYRPARLHRLAE